MACNFAQVLKKQMQYLLRHLEVSVMLIAGLYADDAISDEQKQKIEAAATSNEKVNVLIDILRKKTRREYGVFLEALTDSEQDHVRQELEGAEAKYATSTRQTNLAAGTRIEQHGAQEHEDTKEQGVSDWRIQQNTEPPPPYEGMSGSTIQQNTEPPPPYERMSGSTIRQNTEPPPPSEAMSGPIIRQNTEPPSPDEGMSGSGIQQTTELPVQSISAPDARNSNWPTRNAPPDGARTLAQPNLLNPSPMYQQPIHPGPTGVSPNPAVFTSPSATTSNASPTQQHPVIRGDVPMDTSEMRDPGRCQLDSYIIDRENPGFVLIINVYKFKDPCGGKVPDTREGSEFDVKNLEEMYRAKNFKVSKLLNENATKTMIIKRLLEIKDNESAVLQNQSSLTVIIMTHGEKGYFLTYDCERIKISEIVDYFTVRGCPAMATKPKMFLLQACRGERSNRGVDVRVVQTDDPAPPTDRADASYYVNLPNNSDMLFAYSTTAGFASYRNVAAGSWFIQAYCKAFNKYVEQEPILDLLTHVNKEVSCRRSDDHQDCQMPNPSYTLTKKWYLLGRD